MNNPDNKSKQPFLLTLSMYYITNPLRENCCTKKENFQFSADLVTFTEEILNGKLHFCAKNVPLYFTMFRYSTAFAIENWKTLKQHVTLTQNVVTIFHCCI